MPSIKNKAAVYQEMTDVNPPWAKCCPLQDIAGDSECTSNAGGGVLGSIFFWVIIYFS